MDTLFFDCNNDRRFGVELEFNTANQLIATLDDDEIPLGSDRIACCIARTVKKRVELHGWHPTHNNVKWIVKPDSSCGIEICSPVLKTWQGMEELLKVIVALKNADFNANKLCSMHVHVNISDLSKEELASVIAYYIKCEHVIIDAFPPNRKSNRYCTCLSTLATELYPVTENALLKLAGYSKYYAANIFHFMRGGDFDIANNRKQTMEFRLAEHNACVDAYYAKCWIRFLLHFVECTRHLGLPKNCVAGDPTTGLKWLDLPDVFKILKFDQKLSPGMQQVKNWFILRLLDNMYYSKTNGLFSMASRLVAGRQLLEFLANGREIVNQDEFATEVRREIEMATYSIPLMDRVFGKEYIV